MTGARESYLETDFLSGGRDLELLREQQLHAAHAALLWRAAQRQHATGICWRARTWSLATLSTSGTLQPRAEQVPLTIDAQYVVGFNWTRNAATALRQADRQLRGVRGISFESPQAAFTGATPSTTVTTEPGVGGGLLPNTNNYSIDFAPDIIAKFAVNPGWGHYEIYGMARGFRDRYEPTAGSVAGTNNTTWGGGVGGGLILPFTKPLSFQASALCGNGIGRYGSGGLPDVTVEPTGAIAAIRETDVLAGPQLKPISSLTLYAYGGEEQAPARRFHQRQGRAVRLRQPGL